jgi:hypothetical protein
MNTTHTSAATAQPVDVVLTVTRFKPVLATKSSRGGNGTEFTMKLARRDPRAFVKGDELYVNRPGAPVRFTLASVRGDSQRYYPLGIAFVRLGEKSALDEERLGFVNFPQSATRAQEQALTIVDTYHDAAPGVRYKFSVFVQRGGDGALGIIDPEIIHSGEQ